MHSNPPLFADLPATSAPIEVVRSEGKVLILLRGVKAMLFDEEDVGAMHCAIVALVETHEVSARQVALALGIHEGHISRLRTRYRRHGSAGLVPPRPGPRRSSKLDEARLAQIRELRESGQRMQDIAAQVGVSIGSVSRALQPQPEQAVQQPLVLLDSNDSPDLPQLAEGPSDGSPAAPDAGTELTVVGGELEAEPPSEVESQATTEIEQPQEALPTVAPVQGSLPVQHAGAMMLHVPIFQLGLAQAFETAGARLAPARVHDLAGVVGTLALGFGLGLANIEQFKLAVRGNLGPMAGLPVAPEVRTLRRKLVELSEQVDTVILMREVAAGLVSMEPVWEGLHYVDGHFTDYHGGLQVPKTRDPKRHCAARGRTDTWVHDVIGRPLFFLTSPVHEQLVSVIPRVVNEIREIAGDGPPIFMIFDRGGYSPDLFAWLVEEGVDFACYLKGELEPLPDSEFRRRWWSFEGKRHLYDLATTQMTLGPYTYQVIVKRDNGRQIPIVTSYDDPNPAKIAHLMKLRWRQENGLKDLVHHSFIDGIVEYGGDAEPDPTKIPHPEREKLKAQLADVTQQRQALQAEVGQAVAQNSESQRPTVRGFKIAHSEQLKAIERFIERERELEGAISALPARIRRCDMDPSKLRVALKTERRSIVNTIKLSVDNAERWLARKFLAHFKDLDEYRTQLRSLLRQPGEIRYDMSAGRICTMIHPPDSPKVRVALAALLQDLNAASPRTLDGRWDLRFELRGEG